MKFTITKIGKDNPEYGAIKRRIAAATRPTGGTARPDLARPEYNKLAQTYNALEVGAVLSFGQGELPWSTYHLSNLVKILKHRGLVRHVDYEVARPLFDDDGKRLEWTQRVILIERLTDKDMAIL